MAQPTTKRGLQLKIYQLFDWISEILLRCLFQIETWIANYRRWRGYVYILPPDNILYPDDSLDRYSYHDR